MRRLRVWLAVRRWKRDRARDVERADAGAGVVAEAVTVLTVADLAAGRIEPLPWPGTQKGPRRSGG